MLKRIINWILKLFRRDTYGITQAFIDRKKANTKDVAPSKKDMPKKMVVPRWEKPCKHCGDPMMVSIGQIVFTHRSCRTDYRRHLRSRYA
jgi:hypothetical protein